MRPRTKTSAKTWLAILGVAVLGAAGCGNRDRSAPTSGDEPTTPEEEAAAHQPIPEGTSIGKVQLRRLTKAEYESSIRDVFALGSEWAGASLSADPSSKSGFDNDVELLAIDETRGAELVAAAESIADLPPPPPNAGEPPVPKPGLTTRELYETVHSTKSGCAGCHRQIDPIGFGLEHFDVAGTYRTSERDKPIDPSGSITNFGGATPAFDDHKGLAKLLAGSPLVADCVGGMMASYAFGSGEGKTYTLPESRDGFRSATVSLVDYFSKLAAAPHFVVRLPAGK
ncbi:DUF1588 domain-containing protein [Pendulispora albinea]|uniref:DUF1588 domain-containing protein n=1 Tax=Pendulispora albinea TaxID=2741071 RepID=A0ABZ2M5M5_9BACT